MDVKEAVKIALEYVSELFKEDNLTNLGLEEVIFDDSSNTWKVTIGFSRPWDYEKPNFMTGLKEPMPKRDYKVVEVDSISKKVLSVTIRGEK